MSLRLVRGVTAICVLALCVSCSPSKPESPADPAGDAAVPADSSKPADASSGGAEAAAPGMPPSLDAPPASAVPSRGDDSSASTPDDKAAGAESLPPRSTLEGRWILVLAHNGIGFPGMLIDIKPGDGGGWAVSEVETNDFMPGFSLKSTDTTAEGDVTLVLATPGDDLTFTGKLAKGTVFGNATPGGANLNPAKLIASERTTISDIQEPWRAQGLDGLEKLQITSQVVTDLRQLAQQHTDSTIVWDIYRAMFMLMRQFQQEDKFVEAITAEALANVAKFGDRATSRLQFHMGMNLLAGRYPTHLALPHLEAARQAFEAENEEDMVHQARLLIATAHVNGDDAALQDEGKAYLEETLTRTPFEGVAINGLAMYADQHEQEETAIDLYSRLAALPGMGSDGVRLKELWEKKHGNLDGLFDHLNEVYEKQIYAFAEPRAEAEVSEDRQVVLCELFTGGSCPPCVAADIATGGLEVTYPSSELVVLRYHQHVPAPDPLSNEASQERFQYYEGQGTPTLCINGEPTQLVAGPLAGAPPGYTAVREYLTERIQQSTPIRIELTAAVEGDAVNLSAAATGIDAANTNLRLRMCLAENKVVYPSPNGIRVHEMLVRSMPGDEGAAPADGKLSLVERVDISDLREELQDSVKSVEEQIQQEFPPQPMQLENLHIVAFVQDDATREILQTRALAVVVPSAAPAAEPATGQPGARQPDADKKAPETKEASPDKAAPGDNPSAEAGTGT